MVIRNLTKENRNNFIEENKFFIYKTTYRICRRKLDWKNDDELCIALIAFNKACDNYTEKRGTFSSYASTVIRNSLIDYFRKKDTNVHLTYNSNENSDYIDQTNSLNQYKLQNDNELRSQEIKLLNNELNNFKISFTDLVNNSPKHLDTRKNILKLAFLCSKNNEILNLLRSNHKLPIKNIIILTQSKRKFIEKWRKYIIALIIVISNEDYQYIRSYLSLEVGDLN
ncbi:sigma-70 family RNA polymerase sigma factor [Clostridium sp. DL1XJH146]